MNKLEYMEQLKERLKRLPKKDFMLAVEYYEEYFADAGVENEAKAIEDLGSPQEAAEQIIRDMALSYSKEPVKNVARGFNSLWVVLLALCASPIALPLLFVGVVVIIVSVAVMWLLLLSLLMAGAGVALMGPLTIIAGFTVIAKSFPVFLTCFGTGLLAMGLGTALTIASYMLGKSYLNWTIRFIGNILQKGGKKDVD